MSTTIVWCDVRNVLACVRCTCVLCVHLRIEIDHACVFVDVDVFEDRTKRAGEVEDDWLCFCVQVDHLCVATTFVVEHAIVAPAVLIVDNECALWICRECCLACTGETEEEGCVACWTDVR